MKDQQFELLLGNLLVKVEELRLTVQGEPVDTKKLLKMIKVKKENE